jgi:hypothetical protein
VTRLQQTAIISEIINITWMSSAIKAEAKDSRYFNNLLKTMQLKAIFQPMCYVS